MHEHGAFRRWGRYLFAAVVAAAVGWYAFVAHREVPILDWFDLGVHEAGHLVFGFGPRMLMFVAGSAAQVAVPLAFAWYFGVNRRDAAGGGFCLAWAGASLWDVSVYIADAPVQALPLIGGGEHDWAFLLGPQGWDVMHRAEEIAGFVEFTGGVLTAIGVVIALQAWATRMRRRPAPITHPARISSGIDDIDPWRAAADLPFKYEAH